MLSLELLLLLVHLAVALEFTSKLVLNVLPLDQVGAELKGLRFELHDVALLALSKQLNLVDMSLIFSSGAFLIESNTTDGQILVGAKALQGLGQLVFTTLVLPEGRGQLLV